MVRINSQVLSTVIEPRCCFLIFWRRLVVVVHRHQRKGSLLIWVWLLSLKVSEAINSNTETVNAFVRESAHDGLGRVGMWALALWSRLVALLSSSSACLTTGFSSIRESPLALCGTGVRRRISTVRTIRCSQLLATHTRRWRRYRGFLCGKARAMILVDGCELRRHAKICIGTHCAKRTDCSYRGCGSLPDCGWRGQAARQLYCRWGARAVCVARYLSFDGFPIDTWTDWIRAGQLLDNISLR